MPEERFFSPRDFSTDFMDDPSATEDRIGRRFSLAPPHGYTVFTELKSGLLAG